MIGFPSDVPVVICHLKTQAGGCGVRLISTFLIAVALVAEAPDINAQGRRKGRGNNDRDDQTTFDIHVSIGTNDKRIIHEWFSEPANIEGLPRGLTIF